MSASSIGDILALYDRYGTERYDEDISQLDHALQTAALAEAAGAPDALVAAALLHDVGHLLDLEAGRGPSEVDLHHEAAGSRYLGALFPPEVTAPVALHVRAKRYLCAIDPEYATGLSNGSTASLERQGGSLTPDEADRFAQKTGAEAAVELRRWDDLGKVEGLEVPDLEHFRPLLDRLSR